MKYHFTLHTQYYCITKKRIFSYTESSMYKHLFTHHCSAVIMHHAQSASLQSFHAENKLKYW